MRMPTAEGSGFQMSSVTERSWFAGFRSRPVVLSAPYPASECLQRLAMVTTQRGATSWYLDSRTVGCPEPRLRGNVSPSRIFVARWKDASGRNSFAPWLDVRLEPADGGRAALTGKIGLHPDMRGVTAVIAGGGGLICVAMVVAGIALLVRGQLSGLSLLLWPLGMAAFITVFTVASLRSLGRDIPKLIQEINGVLDSTATFTSPAA